MLRIMKYLSKAEIGQMLIALVTIVGQVYFDLKLPDYMSDITTLVETPGSDMKDIWIAGGKMLLISLGSVACAIITGYIAARVAASFTQRLRSLEFRKVESFGPAEMSQFSTASLITRSTNDITQVQMFITMGLQLIVKSPIMAVWAVCKIAGEGFEWTVATGIAVVILLVAIVIMMAMVMPKFKAMQALTDNINLVARENLTGLRVVRAYNAEDYQESKFTKANKDLTETQLFTNRVMAFMMPLMNTIMNGLMLAVYWIGAYLIDAAGLKDKLTVFSNMVVFSNYSVQVIMSFLLMSMCSCSGRAPTCPRSASWRCSTPSRSSGTAPKPPPMWPRPGSGAPWSSAMSASPTRIRARRCLKASASPPSRARPWRSSAPPVPANPRSSISCRASTTSARARCWSTAWTCATTT